MAKKRSEVDLADQWNVQAMYPSLIEWEKDFSKTKEKGYSSLLDLKGKLGSCKILKQALDLFFMGKAKLEYLYTYAHLLHDVDLTNEDAKRSFSLISSYFMEFNQETSWIEPQILEIPKEEVKRFLTEPSLKEYKFYLEKIERMKEHTLSPSEEEILARCEKILKTPSRVFSSFNNADLVFPEIKDQNGQAHELTHGKYYLYLRSTDRTLRKNAYEGITQQYCNFENTLGDLIDGEMQNHLYVSEVRKYKNCLESALFSDHIDLEVYTNLIDTVHKNIGSLHKYVRIKKNALHLNKISPYDMYVPLIDESEMRMSFDEACEVVIDSVLPLGEEYQEVLRKGLKEDRWTDPYENMHKRSGAYSSGCYGSFPYMLLNFQGNLSDLFTLAHEAGHSMHSYFSWKTQPFPYSGYPIFVAEIASTVNEELLFQHLFKTREKQRPFLLNYRLDAILATFFRQTLFAEFELKLHQLAEEREPITPALLKREYRKLYEFYYGSDFEIDSFVEMEWARVPHFYYDFYVYQYATGISAALSLCKNIFENRERYLSFLSSGGHGYPLDLLKLAGVDLKEPTAIFASLERFDRLCNDFQESLKGGKF